MLSNKEAGGEAAVTLKVGESARRALVKARKVAAYELCGENVPVKSSCPKDANTTRTNDVVSKRCCPYLLRAGKGRYFKCTRINFHKGKHHAHDEGGKCLAVWGG